MDLETENRIAALLMQEATKLRLQAEKEGVQVYLQKPKVRGRPNSRFITATVRGVQQANRAAEVNEMWRVRQKELELDRRLTDRSNNKSRAESHSKDFASSQKGTRDEEVERNSAASCRPPKCETEVHYLNDDGSLGDEEIEEFLQSRRKRGRGAIGSRMDEPGPYMLPCSVSDGKLNFDSRVGEEWEKRVLGPERPQFLGPCDSFAGHCTIDGIGDEEHVERSKHLHSKHTKEKHSKDRHRSKDAKLHKRSNEEKRKKREKKSKLWPS